MESINVTLIYDYGYIFRGDRRLCLLRETSLTDYLMYDIFKNYLVDRVY